MANRRMFQMRYSLQRDIVDLYCKMTIGAAGAPTPSTTDAKGIASVVRNSAGKYTITLQDNYAALLGCEVAVMNSTISAAPGAVILSETVSSASTPSVVIQTLAPAGTAVDPDNGATVMVHIVLRNAST